LLRARRTNASQHLPQLCAWHVAQLAELTTGREPFAAIDGHYFTRDVGRRVGHQEHSQVAQLFVLPEAARRHAAARYLFQLRRGEEA
jgi:hypothetical protein